MVYILLIVAMSAAAAVGLAWYLWHQRRGSVAYARFVSECSPLFDEIRTGRSPDGCLRFEGRVASRWLQVDLVRERLADRGPVQTWLALALRDTLDVDGGFAVTAGAVGPHRHVVSAGYPLRFRRPAHWPSGMAVRACVPAAIVVFNRSTDVLTDLIRDPRIKEISLGPAGARLLWRVRQEPVGRRVFGQFGVRHQPKLEANAVLSLHDGLADLIDAVRAERPAVKARRRTIGPRPGVARDRRTSGR